MHDRGIPPFLHRLAPIPALLLALGSPGALALSLGGGGTHQVAGFGDDAIGDGSEANPWRTITHAFDSAAGGAPTTIVRGGYYGPDNGDGSATYVPDAGNVGTTDTFNYTVDDVNGGTSNVATVEVSVGGDTARRSG
ncbi:MAG: hypothetical protein CMJ84_00370 [Planctomycetes bacterium]|jgi:hypothetical protein|nr:hypothetical protein [Planctomycetota bacterium]MDP6410648.1 hypothetical protein [Planctomycetota bacterium]